MNLEKRLFEFQDTDYAEFQSHLVPGINKESIIGIRTPILRMFAREFNKLPESKDFLKELPHKYYEENLLHAFLIEQIKDFDSCAFELEKFLPFVDNWAVCDSMSPKVLKKNKPVLIELICKWSASSHTYTCRFGMKLLMNYFLDDDFKPEYLEIPASVKSEEYYVNMMIAWFFATALAKQWDAAIPYIEKNRLAVWVHNKTIQKAVESYRITDEQKNYLRSLRLR